MSISAQQILDKRGRLGGSDMAAILGLDDFRTPIQVWAEKTGKLEAEDISDKLCVKLGNMLEQTVAELFMEETGKKVHRVNETVIHPEYPFLAGNIDRRVVGEKAVVEIKTTNSFKLKDWEGEEIPQKHIIQTVFYMALTGAERGYIACLIGNQQFVIKTIEKDVELENAIIQKAVFFWRTYVEKDVMPNVVSCNDTKVLKNLFPRTGNQEIKKLGEDVNVLIDNLEAMASDKKSLEGKIKQGENQIKAILKDHEQGESSRYKVVWTETARKAFDKKTFEKENPEMCKKYTSQAASEKFDWKEISV